MGRWSIGLGVLGTLGSVLLLCFAAGWSPGRAYASTAAAALAAAAAGVAGLLALRRLHDRGILAHVLTVVLTAVGAILAAQGAIVAVLGLSGEQLHRMWVPIASGGLVALLVAGILAARLSDTSRQLADAAARIGSGGGATAPDVSGAEFQRLSAKLAETAQRLEDSRAREQALEATRRELVSWVSHDLRTPTGCHPRGRRGAGGPGRDRPADHRRIPPDVAHRGPNDSDC